MNGCRDGTPYRSCTEMVMLAITEDSVSSLDFTRGKSSRNQVERRSSTKFLVVDHHFLIREALRTVLKQLVSDATVLEAVDGRETMRVISEQADIELVLLELSLPDRDGFSLLVELRERHPTISVVVLSARQDRESVIKALDLGALGFIPKSGQLEVMVSALALVLAGGVYIPPEILLSEERLHSSPMPACVLPGTRPPRPTDFGLTDRQVEVLRLLMKGKSNKAISRVLNIALPTAKNHVSAIFRILKVNNRTEAVIAARVMDWGCPVVESPTTLEAARQSLVG
jgi:DNA-binding NarL/FixJ family response regulator